MLLGFLLFMLVSIGGLAQERQATSNKPIDDEAIQHWESLSTDKPVASDDGKYFVYKLYRPNLPQIVALQSLQDSWKINLGNINVIGFSKKSRFFLYKIKDTFCLYDLAERRLFRSITGVKNSQLPSISRPTSWLHSEDQAYEWVGWQLKNSHDLYILNITTGIERHYHNVFNYLFSQQGTVLVIHKNDNTIKWIDLPTNRSSNVWEGDSIKNLYAGSMAIDQAGKQLAFVVQDKSIQKQTNSIWLYKRSTGRIEEKANNQSKSIDDGLLITNNISFNPDGRYLIITLQRPFASQPPPNDIKVDVWNYKDTFLQSVQLYDKFVNKYERAEYIATINIDNNQLVQLHHQPGDQIKSLPVMDYVVVTSSNFIGNRFWLSQADSNWLISCKDGSRKLLQIGSYLSYHISPSGQYLLYYDGNVHHYYSLELATGKKLNLTASLPSLAMAAERDDYFYAFEQPGKRQIGNWTKDIAGWIANSEKAVVYDNHDIWQLDLSGREAPKNLTSSYGAQYNIRFRLAAAPGALLTISLQEPLLLIALNLTTKENGFYRAMLNKLGYPALLTIGPYTYYHPSGSVSLSVDDDAGIPPIRLGSNNSWIVRRQSDRAAPNYYLTHDFKNFNALTNYTPDKQYNWLRAELITWSRPDGDTNQGILYKPSGFNPTKKYPVIVNVYSRQSDGLYRYLTPRHSNCPVFNIPYMISRGYFVFMPDMHYMIGAHGKSGLISVETGIHALARLPYIDTSKMALTGHSFSGQTAFYVAANSNKFKAIIAGAGWTDMVSSYLQLSGKAGFAKTRGFMDFLEPNFSNYTIWERPDLYMAESPILRADQVTTPLLIFHNQGDTKPIEQALEMYLALYRLQKPVWMLQYDGAGHIVHGRQAIDFTIRITQFFDHYLKGIPPPLWMTCGIRASQKGIDDGYSLDTTNKCGPHCVVCNSYN
jgi:dipeptidyl aminopeptidase/acylaminoacyl peptidase